MLVRTFVMLCSGISFVLTSHVKSVRIHTASTWICFTNSPRHITKRLQFLQPRLTQFHNFIHSSDSYNKLCTVLWNMTSTSTFGAVMLLHHSALVYNYILTMGNGFCVSFYFAKLSICTKYWRYNDTKVFLCNYGCQSLDPKSLDPRLFLQSHNPGAKSC